MPGKASEPAARGPAEPVFFRSPAEFRAWLEKNHGRARELAVGFYKRDSGRPSITWPEAVDQALCFGWIDGVRRSLDAASYTVRFSPRKGASKWSAINLERARKLAAQGRMHPAGRAALEQGLAQRAAPYSRDQRAAAQFDVAAQRQFESNKKAWDFFRQQPPGYRRTATYWVTSAKQEATRSGRLGALIQISEAGRRLDPLKPLSARDSGPRTA